MRNIYTTMILSTILAIAFLGFAYTSTSEIKRLNTLVADTTGTIDNSNELGTLIKENEDLRNERDSLIKYMAGGKDVEFVLQTVNQKLTDTIKQLRLIEGQLQDCRNSKPSYDTACARIKKELSGAKYNFQKMDSACANYLQKCSKAHFESLRKFFSRN